MFFNRVIKSNYPKNIHPETPEEIDIEEIDETYVILRHSNATANEYSLGDMVTFLITVKNPYYYQASTIDLTEIAGVTLAQSRFSNVEPEGTRSTTATYTITEADILQESFTNTISVSINGHLFYNACTINNIEEPNPHLDIVCETTSTPTNTDYELGESINYSVTVSNDGNLTITYIDVETIFGANIIIDATLAPGQSTTVQDTYTVTEEDIINGSVLYEVYASGNYASEYLDSNDISYTSTEDTTVEADYSLNLTYSVSTPTNGTDYALNEIVTITPSLENIGNITADNVEIYVNNNLLNTYNSVAPNEIKLMQSTSYTITSTDITNGYFEINGHVEWTSNEESQENDFNTEIPISNE